MSSTIRPNLDYRPNNATHFDRRTAVQADAAQKNIYDDYQNDNYRYQNQNDNNYGLEKGMDDIKRATKNFVSPDASRRASEIYGDFKQGMTIAKGTSISTADWFGRGAMFLFPAALCLKNTYNQYNSADKNTLVMLGLSVLAFLLGVYTLFLLHQNEDRKASIVGLVSLALIGYVFYNNYNKFDYFEKGSVIIPSLVGWFFCICNLGN